MSKFYKDVHKAAKLASEKIRKDLESRVRAETFMDGVQREIKKIADDGKFKCEFQGAVDLAGKDTIRRGGETSERVAILECDPKLVEAIGDKLAEPDMGFIVDKSVLNSAPVRTISWEKAKPEEPSPAPVPVP